MKLEGTILICKIWCRDSKLKEMGVDNLMWLDGGIDLREAYAIKSTGVDEEIGKDDQSTIYLFDTSFTVDVDFAELFPVWIKIRNK